MEWLLFALATPALYSLTNFVNKFLLDKKVKDPLIITIIISIISFIIGFIIFIFNGPGKLHINEIFLIILAGFFLGIYRYPFYIALQNDDTSNIVPLLQFTPVFVLLFSILFLRETISIRQFYGLILIILGALILSVQKNPLGLLRPRKTLLYVIISSLLYAIVTIIFRFVVLKNNIWTTLTYEYIGMGISAIILIYVFRKKQFINSIKNMRSVVGLITGNSLISILAQMSEGIAISLAPVTLVISVTSSQPFFVFIYGLILSVFFPKIIKEDLNKTTLIKKTVSIFLIFIGVLLIKI